MIKLQAGPEILAVRRGAISWRSVALGLAAALIISALTPFNDFALNNTNFVGSNLPLGLMTMACLFVVLVNGPLMRWRPGVAFTAGEMTVAFSMGLVACAIPSTGLMRYLPATTIIPYTQGPTNSAYLQLLDSIHLPDWLAPTFPDKAFQSRVSDPIVTGFITRWTGNGSYPWAAWVKPALAWAVFLFALFGALLCLTTIVRRQWNENERLPFPLAQLQLALIEEPRPGHFFNRTLRARSFWIVFGLVFVVRGWNALHEYFPANFPMIPMGYDFRTLFAEDPWTRLSTQVKKADVYLIVVGVTFFLSTPVAFSLWAFIILDQIFCLTKGGATGDFTHYGDAEEHLGAVLAFFTAIVWVGRHHWMLVLEQAFRGAKPGEARGQYLSYPFAAWALVACMLVMAGWLCAAGCTVLGAVVTVLLLLMLFIVITRVIAETGLVYGQLIVPLFKPWQMLSGYGFGKMVPDQTFVVSGMLETIFHDFREPLPVYASHGLKLADQTFAPVENDAGRVRAMGRRFIGLLALTLAISYFVSFASTLYVEYTYSSTRDVSAKTPINTWGVESSPRANVLEQPSDYRNGRLKQSFDPLSHVAGGFAVTGILSFLRMRFVSWPLHPIGFLMMATHSARLLWFSIMIGWILKVVIVRVGGATLYQNARPSFLGLILGEMMAAGFWLVVSIGMNALDIPYTAVKIMPS